MIRLLILLALFPAGTGSGDRSSPLAAVRGAGASHRKQYTGKIELGEKELIYTDSNIPIRYDGSLSTIQRDDSTMFFFHSYGCRERGNRSRHAWFYGTELDPLGHVVSETTDADLWDYSGYYQDTVQKGIWILGIYKRVMGDVLAITHSEPNDRVGDRTFDYSIGLGYSRDAGKSWTYCGEIILPAFRRTNVGGGAYLIKDDYLYVYYNDRGTVRPSRKGICVARAPLNEVLEKAEAHQVSLWHKYREGKWDVPALSDTAGTPVIPVKYGGEDCHSDAAYCTALEKYLLTVQSQVGNKLSLYSSSNGVNWQFEILVDSSESNRFMPYSAFVDFDGPRVDCSEVDHSFYIYYPHKSKQDHDVDAMYRRLITIK
jgi:hypothetical protein